MEAVAAVRYSALETPVAPPSADNRAVIYLSRRRTPHGRASLRSNAAAIGGGGGRAPPQLSAYRGLAASAPLPNWSRK